MKKVIKDEYHDTEDAVWLMSCDFQETFKDTLF